MDLPFASYNGGNIVRRARGRCWARTSCRAMPSHTVLERLAREGIDAWVFIGDNVVSDQSRRRPTCALERRTVGYDGVLRETLRRAGSRGGRQDRRLDGGRGAARAHRKRIAGGAATAARIAALLADLLSRRHEPARQQGRSGARTVAACGRAARARGGARRHVRTTCRCSMSRGSRSRWGSRRTAVQARACLVSTSNDEEGFAVAIDALLAARDAVTGLRRERGRRESERAAIDARALLRGRVLQRRRTVLFLALAG